MGGNTLPGKTRERNEQRRQREGSFFDLIYCHQYLSENHWDSGTCMLRANAA